MPLYSIIEQSEWVDADDTTYKRRDVVDVPKAVGEYFDMRPEGASRTPWMWRQACRTGSKSGMAARLRTWTGPRTTTWRSGRGDVGVQIQPDF